MSKTKTAPSAATVESVAAVAVDSVNPAVPEAEEDVQIQIDPELLARTVQMKNARLISMMVHENAVLEVALEQERRNSSEKDAKIEALQAALAS